MLEYLHLLHGSANIDYFQEGEKGLIAAPVDEQKRLGKTIKGLNKLGKLGQVRQSFKNSGTVWKRLKKLEN